MKISLMILTVLVADVVVYIPAVFQYSFLRLGRKPALNKVKKITITKKVSFVINTAFIMFGSKLVFCSLREQMLSSAFVSHASWREAVNTKYSCVRRINILLCD